MTTPTKPRPIWQAYAETGALEIDCPTCHAERGVFCTRAGGRLGRIPCVARAAASCASGDDGYRDFSEPTRERP